MNVKAYSHKIHKELIKFFDDLGEEYMYQELTPNYYSYSTTELTIKMIGTCHKSSYIYIYPEKDNISKKYIKLIDILKDEPDEDNSIVKQILNVVIPQVKPLDYTHNITTNHFDNDDEDLYT